MSQNGNCNPRPSYRPLGSNCNSPSSLFDQKSQVDSIFEYLSQKFYNINNQTGSINLNVEENSGLALYDSGEVQVLSTLYNTLVSDTELSFPVGGAGPLLASEWKQKTIVEVLDAILFPTVLPNYTIPMISLTASAEGIREIGSSVNQTIELMGVKNDGGDFTSFTFKRNGSSINLDDSPLSSPSSDLPNQLGYPNLNNPNKQFTSSYTDTVTVVAGGTVWGGEGEYLSGLPLKNSKGDTDSRTPQVRQSNAPQIGSTIPSNSSLITGIYPFFWGKSNTLPTPSFISSVISGGGANKVLQESTGTISFTPNASAEYVWVAHPSSSTTKTVWFFTSLNQGLISAESFISPPVLQELDSPEGYWNGIEYKIYIGNFLSTTSGSLQLRNS